MKPLLRSLVFIIVAILLIVFLRVRTGAPPPSDLPQPTLDVSYPSLGDAGGYAKQHGVSVSEAVRRFRIQDTAGHLDADLTANESETFAGLWGEHSPEFKIVVLFTENPRQVILPYLRKDYVTKGMADILDLRTARFSLAELVRVQAELLSSLEDEEAEFKR